MLNSPFPFHAFLPPFSLPLIHRSPNPINQPRLFDQLIEQALLLHQHLRRIKLLNLTLLQHHNAIAIQDGINAMRNRNNGPLGKQGTSQGSLQESIGFDVHGGRGFIQNEDIGGREECACKRDELSLALG